ncbi:TetR/AcrR family transcriptional regulator [Catelliglobosispora koreensis]|uniref:TetR/AcrR family transcriptional regulator n=1 Tax=Catelliglobosispora koreensis TaxID=129052 RepID=UPI00036ECBDD|nr:TetR/AcrR family transcriptional regulator [Catelliglobosispora koreensis]
MQTSPLSGRKAQAARNDEVILTAAKAVFTATPDAPISAVAEKAGVGIGALYRRYRSKDELLQRLSLDTMARYHELAEAAAAAEGDRWQAFAAFMSGCVEAGSGALSIRLAGGFTITPEIVAAATEAHRLTQRLLDLTKAAGVLRQDIEVGDISLLLEQLQAVRISDAARTAVLRQRYLTVMLDGLRDQKASPLPGPAPDWTEIGRRYAD